MEISSWETPVKSAESVSEVHTITQCEPNVAKFFAGIELYSDFVEAGELTYWVSLMKLPLLKTDIKDIMRLNELMASGITLEIDEITRDRLRIRGVAI